MSKQEGRMTDETWVDSIDSVAKEHGTVEHSAPEDQEPKPIERAFKKDTPLTPSQKRHKDKVAFASLERDALASIDSGNATSVPNYFSHKKRDASLAYLTSFIIKKNWKFNKTHQIWILNHLWFEAVFTKEVFKDQILKYLKKLTGNAKTSLLEDAKMILADKEAFTKAARKRAKRIMSKLG